MTLLHKSRIWIGPNLKKFNLKRFRIFKEEIPVELEKFLEDYRCRGLLVNCEKYPEVSLKMREKGNLYEILEKKLLEKLGGN